MALLAPTVEMKALADQMGVLAKQMDQIDATLKVLVVAVTGRPFPQDNVLTEPAPAPSPAAPLNG